MNSEITSLIAVVPAAGVGKRMLSACPKQYLFIEQQTILEHTVNRLLTHPAIAEVILALGPDDDYFKETSLAKHKQVKTVLGGEERVDSVLAGLNAIDTNKYSWALVHDAARPCVRHQDIDQLILHCQHNQYGGLLAAPVSDTMKRSSSEGNQNLVKTTVDRENLWHALTPQMYKITELKAAIEAGLKSGVELTDESSAIELSGGKSELIASSSENIKITRPDDLALAHFILSQQKQQTQKKQTSQELKCE